MVSRVGGRTVTNNRRQEQPEKYSWGPCGRHFEGGKYVVGNVANKDNGCVTYICISVLQICRIRRHVSVCSYAAIFRIFYFTGTVCVCVCGG